MASINIFIVRLQRGALILVAPRDYESTTISNAVSHSVCGKESSGGSVCKEQYSGPKEACSAYSNNASVIVLAWLKLTKRKTRTFNL